MKKNTYMKHSIKTPSTFLSLPSCTSFISTLSMPHNTPFSLVFAKSCFSSSSVSDLPLKKSSEKNALMLWKRLYGNNLWAQCSDELKGLNKDFRKMLGELAEFKALSLKDVLTASDGTRKEVSDTVQVGRWISHRNSCDSKDLVSPAGWV
ncbi:hypothetical protein MKX01_021824 [Papaver californicum]|nr:hypothetical protein MKX01_021824 [Papaver californicum]